MNSVTPRTPALPAISSHRPSKESLGSNRASSLSRGLINSTLSGRNTNRRRAVRSSGTSSQWNSA
ncbi:hypothetical protein D3C86_1821600 [compost metagenome]